MGEERACEEEGEHGVLVDDASKAGVGEAVDAVVYNASTNTLTAQMNRGSDVPIFCYGRPTHVVQYDRDVEAGERLYELLKVVFRVRRVRDEVLDVTVASRADLVGNLAELFFVTTMEDEIEAIVVQLASY